MEFDPRGDARQRKAVRSLSPETLALLRYYAGDTTVGHIKYASRRHRSLVERGLLRTCDTPPLYSEPTDAGYDELAKAGYRYGRE